MLSFKKSVAVNLTIWLSLLIVSTQSLDAQSLQIRIGGRTSRVPSQVKNNEPFYSLQDIADILDLNLSDRVSQIVLSGPRGQLLLVDNRPLIKAGDQYILLSSDVWRQGRRDWWVPEDFLSKALPNILDRRITPDGRGGYRLETLGENAVRVDIVSYRDRLSVVFRLSQTAPVEVRDFREYLEVSFEGYLVRAGRIDRSPDSELISGISFNPLDEYGSFEVRKGPDFSHYRDYILTGPPRLVVDIYGRSSSASRVRDRSLEETDLSEGTASPDPDQRSDEPAPLLRRRSRDKVVVLDPGHGGEDYGVDILPEVLEKGLTLDLARQVQEELGRRDEDVRLTRFRDVSLTSEQRSAVANFNKAKAFLALHVGASSSTMSRGPVVYIYAGSQEGGEAQSSEASELAAIELVPWEEAQDKNIESSRRLARLMQDELNSIFETKNSVTEARLAVLAPIIAPAILIETGFLTNPQDQKLLMDPEFRSLLAGTIAETLERFLREAQ